MAADSGVLAPLDIICFISDCEMTTNHDLVRGFRRLLNHPQCGAGNKLTLKEVTRKVGSVRTVEGVKFIQLQARFRGMRAEDIALAIEGLGNQEEEGEALSRDNTFRRKSIYRPSKQTESDNFITPKAKAPLPHPPPGDEGNSSCTDDDRELPPPPLPPKSEGVTEPRRTVRVLPPKRGQAPPELPPKKQGTGEPQQPAAPDLPPRSNPVLHWPPPPPDSDSEDGSSDSGADPDDPPQLPPKPNSGFRSGHPVVGFDVEKKGDSSESEDDFEEKSQEEKRRRFQAQRDVGKSVKDLTKNYDDIANTSQLNLSDHSVTQQKQKLLTVPGAQPRVRRKSASSREDADTYIQLTPEQKQWILAASKNDMFNVKRLYNEEGDAVASTRDPWNGYTALHWAAKHGNQQLVQFLVCEAGLNPDARSRGGYTPLILAACCNRQFVYQYLVNSCGADPDIRDFAGFKARGV